MNKIITFIVLFSFSTNVIAKDLKDVACAVEGKVARVMGQMAGISEEQCIANHANDKFYDGFLGCMTAHKNVAVSTVDGIASLFKLLVMELPAWVIEKQFNAITGILNGDFSPSKIAAKIADSHVALHEELWEKAKEYWELFKKFVDEFKKHVVKEAKGFFCKPMREQHEIMCTIVDEFFLLVFGPGAFLKGAKWTIESAKALKNFIEASKLLSGTQKLSTAERLNAAAEAMRLKALNDKVRDVIKLRNATVKEVTLPDGEKILQYHGKVKGKDGAIHDVVREVQVDAKTKAIDANTDIGKEIMAQMVVNKSGKGSLMFIDVNYLGDLNYYSAGSLGGDLYLKEIGEGIRKSLRPGDLLFKNGGDELVVVISNNNPQVVKQVSQRMINEIDSNPQIRQIFKDNINDVANRYREIKSATSFESLSPAFKAKLHDNEILSAQKDFARFKANKTKQLQTGLEKLARSRGSISVGSALIQHNEPLSTVLSRAEGQSAIVKATYKASRGQDISKYNVEEGALTIPKRLGPPTALDPK